MTLVRIISGVRREDSYFLKQTPNRAGQWNGIQFTLDPIKEADYVIIVNYVPKRSVVKCPPENIWAVSFEPPVPNYEWFYRGFKTCSRVYTTNIRRKGNKYIHCQPALPWLVDKDYDFLKTCQVPEKKRKLSCIVSSKTMFKGQIPHLNFLKKVQKAINFDLYGYGFKRILDKWNGLAPYKYSLAIENYSGLYYWSEKLADCFLSYTMPIYYGCVNINNYFPKESFVWIDINKPEEAIEVVREVSSSNLWQKNLDAIIYARELVLNKYQFFPFISKEIKEDNKSKSAPKLIDLPKIRHIDFRFHFQRLLKKLFEK